jgi:hypothetical protein
MLWARNGNEGVGDVEVRNGIGKCVQFLGCGVGEVVVLLIEPNVKEDVFQSVGRWNRSDEIIDVLEMCSRVAFDLDVVGVV